MEEDTLPSSLEVTVTKVCQKCRSVVGPGLSDIYSNTTLNNNIDELVRSSSEKTLNRLLQVSLKTTFEKSNLSLAGGVVKLPRVGSCGSSGLQLVVGQKYQLPPRKFMTDDIMKIQTKLNLSDKATL